MRRLCVTNACASGCSVIIRAWAWATIASRIGSGSPSSEVAVVVRS
jgi:hypothetical protein